MPVLIILLYYINDLSKLKRYYDQTEFVAQQTVNMIQNISQRRSAEAATSEEKEELLKISKKDLLRIHALAWQTVYPGLTIFRKNSVYPLNHKPITSIYYVEGVDDGKASCIWRTWTRLYESLSKFGYNVYTEDSSHSAIRFLTETAPENIYPTLKLKKGYKKIIIETLIERNSSGGQYSGISDKAAMGLYLASPPARNKVDSWSHMFHSVVIFTPKEGLFSRTAPQ